MLSKFKNDLLKMTKISERYIDIGYLAIFVVFYIGASYLRSDFLEYKNNLPFYLIFLTSLLYWTWNLPSFTKLTPDSTHRYYFAFLLLGSFYIGLSFAGFFTIFDLRDFPLKLKFIPRHAFYIPYGLVVGSSLYLSLKRLEPKKLFSYIIPISPILLVLSLIAYVFTGNWPGPGSLIFVYGVFILISYFYVSKIFGTIFYSLFLIFIFTSLNLSQTLIVLLIPIYFLKPDFNIFSYKRLSLACVVLFLAFLTVSIFFPGPVKKTMRKAGVHDSSTFWRLQYWQKNLATLEKTYLIGVGYGTPYVSLQETEHILQFSYIPELTPNIDRFYVRAQHNSIINQFYRLGILGGLLFLLFNFSLYKQLHMMSRDQMKYTEILNYIGFTFLLFMSVHVFLESPHYFFHYALFVSFTSAYYRSEMSSKATSDTSNRTQ